jgi:hypothetical protein
MNHPIWEVTTKFSSQVSLPFLYGNSKGPIQGI